MRCDLHTISALDEARQGCLQIAITFSKKTRRVDVPPVQSRDWLNFFSRAITASGYHSTNSNSISSRRGSWQIVQIREWRSPSVGFSFFIILSSLPADCQARQSYITEWSMSVNHVVNVALVAIREGYSNSRGILRLISARSLWRGVSRPIRQVSQQDGRNPARSHAPTPISCPSTILGYVVRT